MLVIVGFVAGCGGSSEEAPAEPQAPEPAEQPNKVIADPATPDAPEEAKLTIPEALNELLELPESFILTKIETVDEAKKIYRIEADTRDNPDKVQNKMIKIYTDKGWEEDMNMAQKNNTVIGFSHEGFMIYVEATKGNIGSIVIIDTGML